MSVIIVLPGGGTAPGGKSFTFSGADTTNIGATAFTSTIIDIGPATADRYVIIAATDQNGTGITTVTVNGVNLALDIQQTISRGCYIWSGLVGTAGGAGVATIFLAYGAAAFSDRIIMVWTGRGMTNTVGAATTATGASPTLNIAVTAGDLLIAAAVNGPNTFGGPETPTASHDKAGAGPVYTQTGAEWNRIIATNAAFGITLNAGDVICAATYH